MPKSSSNRRLFQADGYTFIRWIQSDEVEQLLESEEIETCFDVRTDRAIGFKLIGSMERVSSSSSVLPFGRIVNPLFHPPHVNYPIPAVADHRRRWKNHFMTRPKKKFGEVREQFAAAFCHAGPSPNELASSGLANSVPVAFS